MEIESSTSSALGQENQAPVKSFSTQSSGFVSHQLGTVPSGTNLFSSATCLKKSSSGVGPETGLSREPLSSCTSEEGLLMSNVNLGPFPPMLNAWNMLRQASGLPPLQHDAELRCDVTKELPFLVPANR